MPTSSLNNSINGFFKIYQREAQTIFRAPARVNLMGEHTDYNDGFVLPVAIDREIQIKLATRDDSSLRVFAEGISKQISQWSIAEGTEITHDHEQSWTDYLRGVSAQFLMRGHTLQGLDVYVTGNIPVGAGLSSSAALCIAFASALNTINQLKLSPLQLALICQAAENDFVGCQCGIMDQFIIALGQRENALLIDCQDLSFKTIALPKTLAITIINSNVPHRHATGEYNTRRTECSNAAKTLGVKTLRQASLNALQATSDRINTIEYKRAQHVLSENIRVQDTARALQGNDLETLAQLMANSHKSMRDDFEISAPEIDYLVDIIAEVLEENGGVRMTGGGFGGSVVVLAPEAYSSTIEQVVSKRYTAETGLFAEIYHCQSSNGVSQLKDPLK